MNTVSGVFKTQIEAHRALYWCLKHFIRAVCITMHCLLLKIHYSFNLSLEYPWYSIHQATPRSFVVNICIVHTNLWSRLHKHVHGLSMAPFNMFLLRSQELSEPASPSFNSKTIHPNVLIFWHPIQYQLWAMKNIFSPSRPGYYPLREASLFTG